MLFSVAWKNVFRNKPRSLILLSSITIGLVGGLFYMGFSNGMAQQQINNAIKTYVSDLQIHNPRFLLNEELQYLIKNPEVKKAKIKTLPEVTGVCSRLKLPAMIATAKTGTGVSVIGVNPNEEKTVTEIHAKMISGAYFNAPLKNPIVIGKKLAKKLNVKPKSKVVITLQDSSGNITSGLFKVAGVFDAQNSIFEEANVFVLKEDLANLVQLNKQKANEIAVLLKHNKFTEKVKRELENFFSDEVSNGSIVIRTWAEIQPMLEMINNLTIEYTMIFITVILTALGFGIVNTMLMSVMERFREFGMLMAVGMSKSKIFTMIFFETLTLTLSGSVLGIIIVKILISYTGKVGIDLSAFAEGLNSWGYSSVVYPELTWHYYLLVSVLVIIVSLVASLFPARKALKINPTEAMRKDI